MSAIVNIGGAPFPLDTTELAWEWELYAFVRCSTICRVNNSFATFICTTLVFTVTASITSPSRSITILLVIRLVKKIIFVCFFFFSYFYWPAQLVPQSQFNSIKIVFRHYYGKHNHCVYSTDSIKNLIYSPFPIPKQ